MNVTIAVMCQDSLNDDSGNLVLWRIFSSFELSSFPMVAPLFKCFFRIYFEKDEEGLHNFKFNFVDWDGNHIMPSRISRLLVEVSDSKSLSTHVDFVMNIGNLSLTKEGTYSADLFIDEMHAKSITLYVSKST